MNIIMPMEEYVYAMNERDQMRRELETLRARVKELEADLSICEPIIDEIGLLIQDVDYKGSHAEGVKMLLSRVAELERALRLAADEPNIDKARKIADGVMKT
jgi:hypothetical protein